MNGEPSTLVSPGIWGFLAFFVLAVALYLLMRNMNARMRRMSYRAEELQREAEGQQRGERDAGQPDADKTDDGTATQEQTEDPGQKPGTQSQS
jgi:hypothetical protein